MFFWWQGGGIPQGRCSRGGRLRGAGQEEQPGWGCSAGWNSAALTGVDEAEDAERDGNINALNGEFLPQGAEKSIQGKLSRRVGDGKGKPDFTWTQSEVLC